MKLIFFIFMLCPGLALATTLHLSEILKKGYHFSEVRYAAFDEPESAKGKETEEYLAMIQKTASEQVEKNYVLLRELDVDVNVKAVSSEASSEIVEGKSNLLHFSKLKSCGKKSLTLLKAQMFHASMNQLELKLQTEALLAEERGIIEGLQLGIICGIYMGSFGDLMKENPVEEFKLSSFIAKESEKSILKLLKILKFQKSADSLVSIKFFRYLKSTFLINSYKGMNISEIKLHQVKDLFKEIYLTDSKESLQDGSIIEVNYSEQRAELERLFQKVENEIN